MAKYYQGRFKPKNRKKYKGDASNIIYRSGWELKFLRYLDSHPSVVWYSSEEVIVPYFDSIQEKRRRYFPDFIVKFNTKEGGKIFMIEVKPYKETVPPQRKRGKKKERLIAEKLTYQNNEDKWDAAEAYCKQKGWTFQIITENELEV